MFIAADCELPVKLFSGEDHFIINKNIVKTMIDNIKHQYPGVVDGVIPEQISYLKVEKKLKELLNEGKSIKNLIHILEELEEESIG